MKHLSITKNKLNLDYLVKNAVFTTFKKVETRNDQKCKLNLCNKIFNEKYVLYTVLIDIWFNDIKSFKSLKTPQLVSNHNF